jgi:hypothetical protein
MFKKGISYKQMLRLNSERSIALKPFSKALNGVFVFDGFDKLKFDSTQLFVENIRKTNPNFKGLMLFFVDEKAPKLIKGETHIQSLHSEFDLGFVYAIHKSEFGFGSKLKNDSIVELLSSKFDMVVTTEDQMNPLLEGVFAQLSSSLKIGTDNDFNEEFCDVIVEQKAHDNTMDRFVLMSKYLEMLG